MLPQEEALHSDNSNEERDCSSSIPSDSGSLHAHEQEGAGLPDNLDGDIQVDHRISDGSDDEDPEGAQSPLTLPSDTHYIHHQYPVDQGAFVGTRWSHKKHAESAQYPYFPWASKDEYEIVHWLATEGLSQGAIKRFLATGFVSCKLDFRIGK